jgi:hypothetical protein
MIARYQGLSELQLEGFDRAYRAYIYLRGFICGTTALTYALRSYPHHNLKDCICTPNTSRQNN